MLFNTEYRWRFYNLYLFSNLVLFSIVAIFINFFNNYLFFYSISSSLTKLNNNNFGLNGY